MCRVLPFHIGKVYPVRGGYPYVLPDGLPEGTLVKIVRENPPRVFVRDAAGRQFDLFLTNIDAGMEYLWRDQWLREHDPRVKATLAAQRLELHPS